VGLRSGGNRVKGCFSGFCDALEADSGPETVPKSFPFRETDEIVKESSRFGNLLRGTFEAENAEVVLGQHGGPSLEKAHASLPQSGDHCCIGQAGMSVMRVRGFGDENCAAHHKGMGNVAESNQLCH